MTTLREAAQMALDALDKLLDKLNADICDNSGIWDEYCDGGNAMQALRAALAQPEQEPQQREWVGLTDEELLDIADMAYANDLELLQTLQAKLKEKNNG